MFRIRFEINQIDNGWTVFVGGVGHTTILYFANIESINLHKIKEIYDSDFTSKEMPIETIKSKSEDKC